jgi:hypothetical protein
MRFPQSRRILTKTSPRRETPWQFAARIAQTPGAFRQSGGGAAAVGRLYHPAGMEYTIRMYPNIEFNPAAFKHGVTETSIRWVLWHHLFDGSIEEDDENKYLVLGFDEAGNLLEIMRNMSLFQN